MGHGYKMQRSIQVIATIVPTAVVLYLASMSCMHRLRSVTLMNGSNPLVSWQSKIKIRKKIIFFINKFHKFLSPIYLFCYLIATTLQNKQTHKQNTSRLVSEGICPTACLVLKRNHFSVVPPPPPPTQRMMVPMLFQDRSLLVLSSSSTSSREHPNALVNVATVLANAPRTVLAACLMDLVPSTVFSL